MAEQFEKILYEKDGRIALITIDRPDRLNAIDAQTSHELNTAFTNFRDDPDLWVAILTGAGDRAFSTGNDLVAMAEPDAWFAYPYWLDDHRAPDFARTVEIHRKPGYDPAELVLDPSDRWARARVLGAVARKRVGLRYTLDVVPLDPSCVRGTHGRLPDDASDGPVLLCSTRALQRDSLRAVDVKQFLLEAAGIP
jgi:hypothetical protein